MEETTGFIGRARETELALEAVRKGSNALVRGRAGVGKSAFLRHVRAGLAGTGGAPPTLWAPVGTTKTVLLEVARQLHEAAGLSLPVNLLPPRHLARARHQGFLPWPDLARTIRRLPVTETVDIIVTALRKRRFLVFVEGLEMPPSQAELFARILDAAQVVAAMDDDNRRVRIERLVWRFHVVVELKPLPLADCAEIVERWLAANPVRFASDAVRRSFVRHVARDCGGVPVAILGMLEAAASEPEITPARARSFQHKAGVRYFDMTPAVVIGVVAFVALRYFSRGAGLTELYVLSGVASALFIGLRLLAWRLRER